MTEYTIEDVRHIITEPLTPGQEAGIVKYLNTGFVPPMDPCLSCEPNQIRKYISRVQKAERDGTFPAKKVEEEITHEEVVQHITDNPGIFGDPEQYDLEFENEFVPERDEE